MKKLFKLFDYLIIIISLFNLCPNLVLGETRQPYLVTEKTAEISIDIVNSNGQIKLISSVDPNGQSINAVGISLLFPAEMLEAISIDTSNSFCELFIEETIDNLSGRINILCGLPFPGIIEKSNIAAITFRQKKSGAAFFYYGVDSQVLANNGYGTDILKESEKKSIILQ